MHKLFCTLSYAHFGHTFCADRFGAFGCIGLDFIVENGLDTTYFTAHKTHTHTFTTVYDSHTRTHINLHNHAHILTHQHTFKYTKHTHSLRHSVTHAQARISLSNHNCGFASRFTLPRAHASYYNLYLCLSFDVWCPNHQRQNQHMLLLKLMAG